jgi:AIPR protein
MNPNLTVSRVAKALEKLFDKCINMSDYGGHPESDRRSAFLSRALAAFCIKSLSDADDKTAGAAVTDGFHDCGIDALYFDQSADTLFFAQSKWSHDAKTPINGRATGEFVDGVRDILQGLKLERFNDKVKSKEPELRVAVYAEQVRVVFVTAHTATQPIGVQAIQKIQDYIEELNNPVQIASAEYFDLKRVYETISAGSSPQKIKLDITLKDWGTIDKPFLGYSGRVPVIEVAKWWHDHGRALCEPNLRHLLRKSDVNDALEKTLTDEPEHLWYFNNGITMVCESIEKALAGGGSRELGLFHCKGIGIVNGAQTVGTIGTTLAPDKLADMAADGWVQVRIIRSPEGFERRITQATNFQNAVARRDFAAMDPTQHRLATELALDGRKYVFKTGELDDPQGDSGCGLTEATQALACAQPNVDLAVLVKRNIGALWQDITKKPYTDLFNEGLTGVTLWRSVEVMRTVETELRQLRLTTAPRADLIGVHLHRIILHLVFQDPELKPWNHDDGDRDKLLAVVRGATKRIFPQVADYLEQERKSEYLATLAKNTEKCKALTDWFKALLSPTDKKADQLPLFAKPF